MIFQLCSISNAEEHIPIVSREVQLKTFPCSKCHNSYQSSFSVTQAKTHKAISFRHMPEISECRTCHSAEKPNRLNLLDGTLIGFDEMPRLCGQCHGKIEFEWSRGLHGKLIGSWQADKKISLLCSECHEPHAPKFRPMEAVAAPFQSKYVIPKHAPKGSTNE